MRDGLEGIKLRFPAFVSGKHASCVNRPQRRTDLLRCGNPVLGPSRPSPASGGYRGVMAGLVLACPGHPRVRANFAGVESLVVECQNRPMRGRRVAKSALAILPTHQARRSAPLPILHVQTSSNSALRGSASTNSSGSLDLDLRFRVVGKSKLKIAPGMGNRAGFFANGERTLRRASA